MAGLARPTVRRNFGLDLLRAAAVLIVLANHGARGLFEWAGHLRWGDRWTAASLSANISIEWLFVLSGFLIGNMMVRTLEEAGTSWWRVRSFWLRRWFRTVPNYYLFLAINAGLATWGVAPGQASWWHVAFLQNLAWQKEPGFFAEAWTLAADEWFYLVAPLLVVAFAWRRRGLRAGFLGGTAVLILAPMVARLLADVPQADLDGDRLYHWDFDFRTVTLYHLDATGWGVLGAVVSRWFPGAWSRRQGAKALVGLGLMASGIYLVEELYWGGPVWPLAPRLVNVASLTLPALGTFMALPWITSLKPRTGALAHAVAWISLYSYTIYLVHLPALFVLRHVLPATSLAAAWGAAALWLLVVGLASMGIFHAFEKPVSDLRERFTRRVDANPFGAPPGATTRGPEPSSPPAGPARPAETASTTTGQRARRTWGAGARRAQAFLLDRRPAWQRADWGIVLGAAALVASRWWDRARTLLSWDGVTFALATERYDMNALRPHAPGYPLFVMLAKLAKPLVGGDANDALILLAMGGTALAIAGVYWAGRTLLHRAAGLAAATLLAASPVVYVHSVTANVYTADMACSVVVAALAWRAHHAPTRRHVLHLAVGLAVSLGIRPSQAFFLAPVASWGALRPPWAWQEQVRRLALPALAGVAVCLAWFVPMVRLSGGLSAWRRATGQQSRDVVFGHTALDGGWDVAADNLGRLAMYAQWELRWVASIVAGLVVLGLVASALRRGPAASRWHRSSLAWLAAWALPGLLFYALVFAGWGNGPSGYLLVVLPPLLLAAVLAADAALRRLRAATRPAAVALLATACLVASTGGLAAHRYDVEDVLYRERDAWADGWSALPAAFPPDNTSIVALWNFAYVWWTFPEYVSYNYRAPRQGPGESPDFLMVQVAHGREAQPDWYDAILAGPSDEKHLLPPGTQTLVLFDFQLAGENGGERQVRADVPVHEATLPNGWRILYVRVDEDRPHLNDYFTMDGAA